MINTDVQHQVDLIDGLFVDWCSFCLHEPTRIKYESGDTLEECMVGVFTDNPNDPVIPHILLSDLLITYCETHIAAALQVMTNKKKANDFYGMLVSNFRAMDIHELYSLVIIRKINKKYKSEFAQFAIVQIPEKDWVQPIADNLEHNIKTQNYVAVNVDADTPYMDDPIEAISNYVSCFVRLLIKKTLNYEIAPSD